VCRRFLDLLVADTLYLQTPFVGAVEDLGLHWVINLKDNQPASGMLCPVSALGPSSR
jgi:hypothetical protein